MAKVSGLKQHRHLSLLDTSIHQDTFKLQRDQPASMLYPRHIARATLAIYVS